MMGTLRCIVLLGGLVGCSGDVFQGGGGGGGGGGGVDAKGGADAHGIVWNDASMGSGGPVPCVNGQSGYGDGHHNTGRSCFQSCHNHGFTLAGSIYQSATALIPFAGANIEVTDSNGTVTNLLVQQNGNFYTSAAISFPVTIYASDCPSAAKMTALATNDCNAGNCHSAGTGGDPVGAAGQMHVP
jgi:hypothetical protein